MSIQNSCAFTGHRPAHFSFKYDERHPDCIALKEFMRREVISLVKQSITTFYSDMALGVDTWGAEIILDLKKQYSELKLIAVLPCETQANRWSVEQRERYFNLLPLCDDVIYISSQYTSTCMLDRNRYMVDNSKYIIAVYDGQDKGGTAYTVKYAKQNKRDVIIIPASNCSWSIDFGEVHISE